MSEINVRSVLPEEWEALEAFADRAKVKLPLPGSQAAVFVAERMAAEDDPHPAGPIGIAVCRWSGLSGTVEGKITTAANSSAPMAHDGLLKRVESLGQVMSMPFHRRDGRS